MDKAGEYEQRAGGPVARRVDAHDRASDWKVAPDGFQPAVDSLPTPRCSGGLRTLRFGTGPTGRVQPASTESEFPTVFKIGRQWRTQPLAGALKRVPLWKRQGGAVSAV